MSIKYLAPVDLGNNELQNALAHIVAVDPTGIEAKVIYNSTGHVWKYFNGTAWIDPIARANHTGTQLAVTISDFNATVQLNRLDQLAAPIADVSLNSRKITNLLDPVGPQDAATKAYADATASGLDFKQSVRVASTVNINTASPGATIDGITMAVGERVLLKDQTTASQNGIYVWSGAATPMTRAADADSNAEVTSGMYVFVSEGTANIDSGWVLATNDPIVLNTTSLTFTQFSGAGQVAAGNGITKTGNTISVNNDTTMFQFNSGQLQLRPLYQTRKMSSDVGNGSLTQIDVVHSLGTRDVSVQVARNATPWDVIFCDVELPDTNTVRLRFTTAPTAAQYRVIVVG